MPFEAFALNDELEQETPLAAPNPGLPTAAPSPAPTFEQFSLDASPEDLWLDTPQIDSASETLRKHWRNAQLKLATLPDKVTRTISGIIATDNVLTHVNPKTEHWYDPPIRNTPDLEYSKTELARSFKKIADAKTEKLAVADEMLKENRVMGRSILDPINLLGSVVEAGVGDILPMIAGSLAAGPAGGASVVASSVFFDEFDNSNRVRGRTVNESLMDASFKTAFEFGTERLALGKILKPGGTMAKRVLKSTLAEGQQEMWTEIFDIGYNAGILNETMPVGDAIQQVIAAGIVGSVMGGSVGIAMHPLVTAEEKRRLEEFKNNISADFGDLLEGGGTLVHDSPNNFSFVPDTTAVSGGAVINANAASLPANAIIADGPVLTQAQKTELLLTEKRLRKLQDLSASEQDPGKIEEMKLEALNLANRHKDLERRARSMPEQLTLGVEGLKEKQETGVFTVPKEEFKIAPVTDNDSVNTVEFDETLNAELTSLMTEDEAFFEKNWVDGQSPSDLVNFFSRIKRNLPYQAKLQEILATLNSNDYVTLFRGHRANRPAFTNREVRTVGNATLDPKVAEGFAVQEEYIRELNRLKELAGNVGEVATEGQRKAAMAVAVERAMVSVVKVPKAAIRGASTLKMNKAELFFDPSQVRTLAHYKPNDRNAEAPRIQNTSYGAGAVDVQIRNIPNGVVKVPLIYTDLGVPIPQTNLPGMGEQQLKEMPSGDVGLDQFALFSVDILNPKMAMSQTPLGLAPAPGVMFFQREALENVKKHSENPATRTILIEMSPQEFLDLASYLPAPKVSMDKTTFEEAQVEFDEKDSRVHRLLTQGKVPERERSPTGKLLPKNYKFAEIPELFFNVQDGVAYVTGHEGRHRARALLRAGVQKMPVQFTSINMRFGEQTDPNRPGYIKDWPTVLVAQESFKKKGKMTVLVPGTHTVPFPVQRGQTSIVNIDIDPTFSQPATKSFAELLENLFKNGKGIGIKIPRTLDDLMKNGGMDKYNWSIRAGWTLRQLAKANTHIPGLMQYLETVQAWHSKKGQWIALADQRIHEWMSLTTDRSDRLANFLYELTEMKYVKRDEKGKLKEEPRWPTDEEFKALVDQHRMDGDMLELYYKVKEDFNGVLEQMRKVMVLEAKRLLKDDALAVRLLAIDAETAKLKKHPYFPMARFGDWTIVVKDANGKLVHMEAFESEHGQKRDFKRVRNDFPESKGFKVVMSKLREETNMYKGLPPLFMETVKEKLNLTPEQEDELDQVAFAWSSTRSFKRHFEQRSMVPGYSKDAMRTYAMYFFHGASHLARIEFEPSLSRAIKQVRESSNALLNAGITNVKRVQIVEHLDRHLEYIMNPDNEWAGLRSAGFLWYLGFVPKSALVNLTQVPFVTRSFLASQYGEIDATGALLKASVDLKNMYAKDPKELDTPENQQFNSAVQMAVSQLWLEESQAMELAAVSQGSVVERMLPGNAGQRKLRQLSYAAAFMFQTAEKYNRRVTMRAAWNLAMKKPDSEYLQNLKETEQMMYNELLTKGFNESEAGAYLAARDAVQTTQLEYAKWNRPQFMRGKVKSNVFLFYNYLQGMVHNVVYMPGNMKYLLTLLFMGGLMGLPGAEDIKDLVKFASRKLFGKYFDVEESIRELLVELGADDFLPIDFFLHGASRYSFGLSAAGDLLGLPIPSVDLSGSLSMGDIIPGTTALASVGDFDHKFLDAATDVGGGTVGAAVNMLQAVADNENPDHWKRWERAMPSFLKGLSKAVRYQARGFESNRNGAQLVSWNPAWIDPEQTLEIVAQAGGFTPTRVSQAWNVNMAQMEVINFWKGRQAIIMNVAYAARISNHREGLADVRKAIRQYNDSVPMYQMKITGDTLKQSFAARTRAKLMFERGIPTTSNKYKPLANEVRQNYPETSPVRGAPVQSAASAPLPPGWEIVDEQVVQ